MQILSKTLGELRAIFAWWTEELGGIVHELSGALTPALAMRGTLEITDSHSILNISERNAGTRTVTLPPVVDDRWNGPIDHTALTSASGLRTAISLSKRDVLVHDMSLPLSVRRELCAAVELQLEQFLPLPRDEVAVVFRIVDSNRDTGRMRVRVVVARHERVAEVYRAAKCLGLKPRAIGYRDETGTVVGSFLGRQHGGGQGAVMTKLHRKLALSALALSAVLAVVSVTNQVLDRYDIERELTRLAPEAEDARRRSVRLTELNALQDELSDILSAPDAREVAFGLNESMPAESVIRTLEIVSRASQPTTLDWTAQARSQEVLMNALNASPHLREPELISSLAGNDDGDQLHLKAEYQPATQVAANTEYDQ
jgi:hypothetical protein